MRVFKFPALAALATLLSCTLAINTFAQEWDDDDDVTAEELMMQEIPVDERIFQRRWTDVPFNKDFFTYTDAQMEARWGEFMRGLRAPFPSPDFLEYAIERYPDLVAGVDAFNGDYEDFSRKLLEVWRLFLRGDFQESREKGLELGPIGLYPAMFSQIMYAIYLTERQSDKYMLLQDIANRVAEHMGIMEQAAEDPDQRMQEMVAFAKLGQAYAIARIAEESPVPVIITRGYIGLIKDGAEEVLSHVPDHPLGHAFVAGVDAGIMRRVGRATGRITYGARGTTVDQSFTAAFEMAPDIPILNYEYANAILYTSRRRDLNEVFEHLERATRFQPAFSMDALDTMYGFKRLQEVRLFNEHYRSFRQFERQRRGFARVTDHNLTNVMSPVLTLDMLENPENYKLPPRD